MFYSSHVFIFFYEGVVKWTMVQVGVAHPMFLSVIPTCDQLLRVHDTSKRLFAFHARQGTNNNNNNMMLYELLFLVNSISTTK